MSTPTPSKSRTPWFAAAVLGVVAVGLAVLLVVGLLPDRKDKAAGLTADQQAAMSAASQQVVNLLTYTRKHFDADFQRALSGMTGQLLSDQQKLKDKTLQAMTKNKIDLKGEVSEVAYEGSDDSGNVQVLVSATGYQVGDNGTPVPATYARFELTMQHQHGAWLAANLQNVGIS